MNILVANNQLSATGGTENYTYAIIKELLQLGHDVEYFSFEKGICSDKIDDLGVPFMSKSYYDLIIANHKPVISYLFQYGFIIQTTHGILPGLEEPSHFADHHVCVSRETQKYLSEMNIQSDIILNGVDCERFFPGKPINKELTCVLSLSQSEEANEFIGRCCEKTGVEFIKCNRYIENVWEIEKEVNKADMVIGMGRSLYDAMACGRTVISYDRRYGNYSYEGDGYLDKSNLDFSLSYNCTGRGNPRLFTEEQFIDELKKYKSEDGIFNREFAVKELNIRKSVENYLDIYKKNNHIQKDRRLIDCYNEMYDKHYAETEILKTKIKNLRSEINSLKSSNSWFLTAPLRGIMRMIKRLKPDIRDSSS